MIERSFLARVLAGVVGVILGGLLALVSVVTWVGWHPLVLVLPFLGGAIGFVARDRGIRALIRGITLE
jgi:hypothetical protein